MQMGMQAGRMRFRRDRMGDIRANWGWSKSAVGKGSRLSIIAGITRIGPSVTNAQEF
jgi:hypothetical protein